MTWTTFNNYTDSKKLPINTLDIDFGTNQYTFYKNIDVSKASFRCLLDDNDRGSKDIVGYEIYIECVPLQNKMENFIALLQDARDYDPVSVTLSMTEKDGILPKVTVNADDSNIEIADWSCWWEGDANTDTELKLIVQGIFSVDLLDATSPKLFTNAYM